MLLLLAVVELNLLDLMCQVYPLLWRNPFNREQSDHLFKWHKKAGAIAGAHLDGFHAFGLYGEHGKILVFPEGLVDLFEVHHVVWAYQQQTQTLFGGSRGSATTMDVSLRSPGNLVFTRGHD